MNIFMSAVLMSFSCCVTGWNVEPFCYMHGLIWKISLVENILRSTLEQLAEAYGGEHPA